METTVVNINKTNAQYDVYIGRGRGSIWGNPFILNRHGNRTEVIAKHRQYLIDQFLSEEITWDQIKELHGQALGCYCHPLPCHGDTVKYFADSAVRCASREEWLEFVRKEKGETDERPPEVRLLHLQTDRTTLEKKLENAQQLHRKASNGGGRADMRIYDALLQQAELNLKRCVEEIEALEKEIGVSPAPPKKRRTQPKQRRPKQKQPKQEKPEMSPGEKQMMEEFAEFQAWKKMKENGSLPSTNSNSEWSYETTKPNRNKRRYVEISRGREDVLHICHEHWDEKIFRAAQKDDINPPEGKGEGMIFFRTEIYVDGKYVARLSSLPEHCPNTLQAVLEKFGDEPYSQKPANVEFEAQAESKNYHFPKPEKTAVDNITAEEQEGEEAESDEVDLSEDEEALEELVLDLTEAGLSRPAIKAEIKEDYGIEITTYKIKQIQTSQ